LTPAFRGQFEHEPESGEALVVLDANGEDVFAGAQMFGDVETGGAFVAVDLAGSLAVEKEGHALVAGAEQHGFEQFRRGDEGFAKEGGLRRFRAGIGGDPVSFRKGIFADGGVEMGSDQQRQENEEGPGEGPHSELKNAKKWTRRGCCPERVNLAFCEIRNESSERVWSAAARNELPLW
jgi:hypothetical protein